MMWNTLKKWLVAPPPAPALGQEADPARALAQWARAKKLQLHMRPDGQGYSLEGQVKGKALRLERGAPLREYIQGVELRASCDLQLPPQWQLLIVNRHLKKSIDQHLYSGFRDTMEAMSRAQNPDELLSFGLYGELNWPGQDERFANDYCVLAEDVQFAQALLHPQLLQLLSNWPVRRTTNPVVIMLMRGRVYLRMQFDDELATLAHALCCLEQLCSHILRNRAAWTPSKRLGA